MEIVYVNPGEPVAEIKLIGHLDTLEAPALLEQVRPVVENVSGLILDCSEMSYLTSTGLRALMNIGKAMLAKQGKMVVCGLDGLAKTIYLSAGFAQIFPPAETVEDAREALQ